MRCGIIEDNKPKCPKCSNTKSKTLKVVDVDVAMIDEEPHFEFITRCRKCDTKFYYFLDTEMIERKSVDRNSDRYSRVIKESSQEYVEDESDYDN